MPTTVPSMKKLNVQNQILLLLLLVIKIINIGNICCVVPTYQAPTVDLYMLDMN